MVARRNTCICGQNRWTRSGFIIGSRVAAVGTLACLGTPPGLGRKAIAERYATLWFIGVEKPRARSLFDPREFPEQFSHIRQRLPKKRFFIEQAADGTMRLGYFVIDLRSDVRRLARQSTVLMRRFIDRGWFNDYLVSSRFEFVVLTYNQDKAMDIARALRSGFRKQLARCLQALGLAVRGDVLVPTQVLVVPGLDPLIPQGDKHHA